MRGWHGRCPGWQSRGSAGYVMGRRALDTFLPSADAAPGSASEGHRDPDVRALMRRVVSEVFEQSIFRAATSLPQDVLAVVISARGVMDLGLP